MKTAQVSFLLQKICLTWVRQFFQPNDNLHCFFLNFIHWFYCWDLPPPPTTTPTPGTQFSGNSKVRRPSTPFFIPIMADSKSSAQVCVGVGGTIIELGAGGAAEAGCTVGLAVFLPNSNTVPQHRQLLPPWVVLYRKILILINAFH
jgi:hypothetical protein